MRADDIIHTVRKNCCTLQLRLEHLFGEHRVRMVEDSSKERVDEARIDAISEPPGQNPFTLELEVFAFVQVVVIDQELRLAFLRTHSTPDLRHEQTDIVVDAELWSDTPRRCQKALMTRKYPRNQ